MHRGSEIFYAAPVDGLPADDPFRALPVKLHRAREAFVGRIRSTLTEHGLTDPQWRVLRILDASEEIDLSELAGRSMLLGPSLSRILRDLEARALTSRRSCDQDGRRFLASITTSGRDLIQTISPELAPIFKHLKDGLSGRKVERLNALLDELIDVLNR